MPRPSSADGVLQNGLLSHLGLSVISTTMAPSASHRSDPTCRLFRHIRGDHQHRDPDRAMVSIVVIRLGAHVDAPGLSRISSLGWVARHLPSTTLLVAPDRVRAVCSRALHHVQPATMSRASSSSLCRTEQPGNRQREFVDVYECPCPGSALGLPVLGEVDDPRPDEQRGSSFSRGFRCTGPAPKTLPVPEDGLGSSVRPAPTSPPMPTISPGSRGEMGAVAPAQGHPPAPFAPGTWVFSYMAPRARPHHGHDAVHGTPLFPGCRCTGLSRSTDSRSPTLEFLRPVEMRWTPQAFSRWIRRNRMSISVLVRNWWARP